MTYRDFKALARRVREQATPAVDDTLLRTEEPPARRPAIWQPSRVRWGMAAVAVAACVAVVAGVVLTQHRPLSPLPPVSDPVGSGEASVPGGSATTSAPVHATSPSGGISLTLQAPAWYAPGAISVQELISSTEADNGGRITQAGVLDITSRSRLVAGHEECGGIYYYADADKVECCWHMAQAALQAKGLWDAAGHIYVADYLPTRRVVLFQYEKAGRRTAYLYDAKAQTLKALAGPLWNAGSTMGRSLWPESGRTCSLLLNTDANGEETLLLVNLLTGEMKSVAPWAHKRAEDGYFSPTGKYIVYTKGDSDVSSVKRQTVVYTVATHTVKEIQGQVRHILPDDSGMVVETPDGPVLFSGDTGKTTPYADAKLPAWYRYHVREGKRYANDCRPLLVVDLLTGETVSTLPKEVHAWQTDSEGRYLYYYVRESDGVTCRDIATGQEFSVPVSREFVDMQRRYGDKEIQFYLLLDEQQKTLQLSYIRYDRPREDSQAIQEQLNGDVSYQYTQRVSEGVDSLADFAGLIDRFPEGLALGRGDGFVYLDCTAWKLIGPSYWVEDYRTNSLYFVTYNNEGNIVYINADTKLGVYTLSKEARAYTDSLLKSGKIPVVQAVFDYGRFIKNGKVDQTALAAYNRRTEALMAAMDYYLVYTKDELSGDTGVRYEQQSARDLQELREFLDFVNTLTFRHTEDYWDYQDGYQVKIDLDTETVWFGRYGGKPVVVIGTHYAHLSEGDYTRWMDWAMNKAKECLTPSEEPAEEEPASTTADTPQTVVSRRSGAVAR